MRVYGVLAVAAAGGGQTAAASDEGACTGTEALLPREGTQRAQAEAQAPEDEMEELLRDGNKRGTRGGRGRGGERGLSAQLVDEVDLVRDGRSSTRPSHRPARAVCVYVPGRFINLRADGSSVGLAGEESDLLGS